MESPWQSKQPLHKQEVRPNFIAHCVDVFSPSIFGLGYKYQAR